MAETCDDSREKPTNLLIPLIIVCVLFGLLLILNGVFGFIFRQQIVAGARTFRGKKSDKKTVMVTLMPTENGEETEDPATAPTNNNKMDKPKNKKKK